MGDCRSDEPDVRLAQAALLKGFSIEIVPTDQRSVEDAKELLAPGTEVFLAAPPSRPVHAQVEVAKRLRRAGLVPFPHIPARSIASLRDLDILLARLASEAGVDRVLVLAGDRDRPVGDLSSSLQIIRSGFLPKHGIHTVAIAGYPEGHPRIPEPDLHVALEEKMAACRAAGLSVDVVTQFCFEAEPILSFARHLRGRHTEVALRVGLAGPASPATLLRYALLCGVGPSLRVLKQRQDLGRDLGDSGVLQRLVAELARSCAYDPSLRLQGIHFFTFASPATTIRWLRGNGSRFAAHGDASRMHT